VLIESERLNDVFRDEGAFRSMIDERRVLSSDGRQLRLRVASMVRFLQRLRSEQSLKHAVVVLQESMKNFVEHSYNVTKCGAVNHIASSFGCCCID